MSSSTTSTSTMPTATRPPFISYSSFFASGLLAVNTPLRVRRSTVSNKHSESSFSDFSNDGDAYYASRSDGEPSTGSSPNRDMDVDATPTPDAQSINLAAAQRRSATPTPLTLQMKAETEDVTPVQTPQPASATIKPTPTPSASAAPPRLRRRKSSLTMAASPISAIRSPTRAAKHQQECMQKAAPAAQAHARARSGSLGGDVLYNASAPSPVSPGASLVYGVSALSVSMMTAATDATSMLGRMRSGSCSNAAVVPKPGMARPRRIPRRVPNAVFPAPRAPPPNGPLPALPARSASTPTPKQQIHPDSVPAAHGIMSSPSIIHVKGPSASSVSRTSARARGLSVSSSMLSGEENWINEEH